MTDIQVDPQSTDFKEFVSQYKTDVSLYKNPKLDQKLAILKAAGINEALSQTRKDQASGFTKATLTSRMEICTGPPQEAMRKISSLLSLWLSEVRTHILPLVPSNLHGLLLPSEPVSRPWRRMDLRQVADLSSPDLSQLTPTKDASADDLKKALQIAAVELMRAHVQVLDSFLELGLLANCTPETSVAVRGEMLGTASPAEIAAAGATVGAPIRNAAVVIILVAFAISNLGLKSKGTQYLVSTHLAADVAEAFFLKLNANRLEEAKEILCKELVELSRRESHFNLIVALSNYKQHTNDRVSSEVCFRVWSALAPYLSAGEQAYILARIGTTIISSQDNYQTFEAVKRSEAPADTLANSYELPPFSQDNMFKILRSLPHELSANYAELAAKTKALSQGASKEMPASAFSRNGNAHGNKNFGGRGAKGGAGREHRGSGANYSSGPVHDDPHFLSAPRSVPSSMMAKAGPSQGPYQAPGQGYQRKSDYAQPLVPANFISSQNEYDAPAPGRTAHFYEYEDNQGAASFYRDENKRNTPHYTDAREFHDNWRKQPQYYDYHPDLMMYERPTGIIPGGARVEDYIFKESPLNYTLYDDAPRDYVFSNSLNRDMAKMHLLSMQMKLNGHDMQATIDTGSAYSIIDPTLAANPLYNARATDKKVLLSSIGGPIEVPVVLVTMERSNGEKTEIKCAIADLSKSCHDRLLIGFPDVYRLGYYVTVNSMEDVRMQKTIEIHSDEIMDPTAGFDDGLDDQGNPEWDKHPFLKAHPELLELAKKLAEITPDKHITFPGSEMPIHTDRIDVSAYSNMRVVQGEIGVRIAQEVHKWRERNWVTPVTTSHERIVYIPLLAVVKKNGDLRICLDFRRFNPCVKPLECVIPNIHDFQESFRGMKYFTEIDLSDAFMQLLLRSDNYYKLGIRTLDGYYTLNRAPFGLHTVPAHFQATIERMIAPIKHAKSYFDNVIIATETPEEQADALKAVMNTFLHYGVRVNMAKLKLCKTEIKMLGMIVSGEGIRADPEKIAKCLQMKKPETATEMRRYIGATNFQRIFYPHASALMAELNGMINDKSKGLKWSPSNNRAYDRLKKALTCEIALFFPKAKDKLVMYVDASDEGIAGALGVMDGDKFRVWRLHSKNISKVRHWSPTTKELFALISSLNEFYPYIFGRHVTVYTDHLPLLNELRIKEPSKQIARWFESIGGLTFSVEYVPGKNNVLADYLSRVSWETDKEALDAAMALANMISAQTLTTWDEWQREQRLVFKPASKPAADTSVGVNAVRPAQDAANQASNQPERPRAGEQHAEDIQQEAALNIDFKKRLTLNNAQVLRDKALIREHNIRNGGLDNTAESADAGVSLILDREQEKALFDRDILWTYKNDEGDTKVFPHGDDVEEGYALSRESQYAWISLAHADSGHGGNNAITSKLQQWNIDFPYKVKKIQSLLDSCTYCMRAKAVKHQHLPQRNQYANQPFAKIAIDTAQLPFADAEGVKNMLVIVDVFTRYTWAIPLKNLEDTTVARALVEWIWDHSMPVEIQSDQGTHFVNVVMKEVVDTMRVVYNVSVPYYPQSNGVVERAIGTIKMKLNVIVAQSDGKLPWSTYLKAATHSMNTVAKVYHGQVPFDMLYAIQAVPPVIASSVTLENDDIDTALLHRHEQLLQAVSFQREQAIQRIHKANEKRNDAANKNRIMKPLEVGDMVLAKVLGKDNVTNIRWFGPYEVHEIDKLSNYTLKAPNGNLCLRRFPRSHLKKADMSVRDKKMVADKIVDARVVDGALEYRVGFLGYNKDSDVWARADVVREKFPNLLSRFEEAKEKLMMEVSLEEGQKLSELLDEEDLATLDSAVAAPRMGVTLIAGEGDDDVADIGRIAPLGSRFGAGEEEEEINDGHAHQLPPNPSNAEPQIANNEISTATNPPQQQLQKAQSHAQQLPIERDPELLELLADLREAERKRNEPQPQVRDTEPPIISPAEEARFQYYAQQRYGSRRRGRGYVRPFPRQSDEEG
mgnify:CR=1 FL=1